MTGASRAQHSTPTKDLPFPIHKYLHESEDLDEIDLADQGVHSPSNSIIDISSRTHNLSGKSPKTKVTASFSTDHADEEFETIQALPQAEEDEDVHDAGLLGSFTNIDDESESGETVEIISTCGQSDGDTIDSAASDGDYPVTAMNGSQLRFPDPSPPLGTVYAGTPMAAGGDAVQDSCSEFAPAIEQSEATIRAHDDDRIAPTMTESRESVEAARHSGFLGRFRWPRRTKLGDHLHGVGTWTSPLRFLFPIIITATLLSCFIDATLKDSFASRLPFLLPDMSDLRQFDPTTFFRPGPDAHSEMLSRREQLGTVLAAEKLKNWVGESIEPSVLTYPTTLTIGDGATNKWQTIFQTDVIAKFASHDQLLVSLPKARGGRRYLREPRLFVELNRQPVSILEQKDLIDGFTYVKLEADPEPGIYSIHVECEHIQTSTKASNQVPWWMKRDNTGNHSNRLNEISARMKKAVSSEHKSSSYFHDKLPHLTRDFRSVISAIYNPSAANLDQAKSELLDHVSAVRSGLHVRYGLAKDSTEKSYVNAVHRLKKAFARKYSESFDVAAEVSVVVRNARLVTKAANSEVRKALHSLQIPVEPVIQYYNKVLFRAQRNGKGIARRLQKLYQEKAKRRADRRRNRAQVKQCKNACGNAPDLSKRQG